MPEFSADDALSDALRAFKHISETNKGPFVLIGSSSGGQLAAQASQAYAKSLTQGQGAGELCGVLLRAPVTCDASDGGVNLLPRFRDYHTTMTSEFHTSILSGTCVDSERRTTATMPLEAKEFSGLPSHWIQISTNVIFYSDRVCCAEGLRKAGVEVKLDVVVGWPHTFWLKAPFLERAVEAEKNVIEGVRWLVGE